MKKKERGAAQPRQPGDDAAAESLARAVAVAGVSCVCVCVCIPAEREVRGMALAQCGGKRDVRGGVGSTCITLRMISKFFLF